MAQQVTERVIQINTTKAVNSIRELRAQIKQLTEVQKDLDMESEEFAEISEELTGAQVKLRNAVKGNTAAVEGSYKWYSKQLQMLKEQRKWMAEGTEEYIRATEKLSELDQKLKEMDAEIGVFSRNVGNYGNAFTGLQGSVRQAAKEFPDLTNGASAFFRSAKESIPEVINGIAEFAEAEAAATGTTASFETAIKGLGKAFLSWNVILQLVVSLLAEYGDEIVEWVKGLFSAEDAQERAARKAKELNVELGKLAAQSSAEKIVRIKELAQGYRMLGDTLEEKRKFVEQYADELDAMGIEMDDINDADRIFIKSTDKYIEAVMARARADAARSIAAQKYEEYLSKRVETENEIASAQADLYEYGKDSQSFWQKVDAFFSRRYGKTMPESQREDAEAAIAAMRKELEQLERETESSVASLFRYAAAQDAFADTVLNPEGEDTISGSSSTPTEHYVASMQEYEYRGNSTSKIDTPTFSAIDESIDQSAAIERDKARLRALIAMEGATAEERKAIERDLQDELAMIEEMRLIANEIGLREMLNDEELTADERMAIEERLTQNQIEQAQLRLEAEKAAEAEKLALAEKTEKEKEALAKKRERAEADMYKNTSSLLKSAADLAKEDSKEQKALSAAAILMDTYASAMAGWKAGMEVGGPIAPFLAGANVAASVAMGAVQLKNLLSVAADGANATSVAGASAPSVAGSMPAAYTRNLMGDSEMTALNQDTRVYVVESDITEAQNAAKVRVESASF